MAAGVVLLAIVATWNTVWAGVKNLREARKPNDDLRAKVAAHDQMLARDKARLDDGDQMQRLLLRAISQLIEHEVSGNHDEQLKAVQNDINEYLINR